MTEKTGFIYHPDYLKYQFGPTHPFKPIRGKFTLDLIRELGVFNKQVKYFESQPAKDEDLLTVHSMEYIQFVKKMCQEGRGYLDTGDTPAIKGLYEGSLSVIGGSLLGAKLIMDGTITHAFNPGGGLHHAKRDAASGFCVFNDIAIIVKFLQKHYNLKKIAIVDIDGHHGDGTQEIFYDEPILKISSHRVGIFPGTGYVTEVGIGKGKGYSVNIPLPRKTGDDSFLYAFNEVVLPLIKTYKPEIILGVFGADGHYQDPLVDLGLTTKTFEDVSMTLHNLSHKYSAGRLLFLGAGGYDIQNTIRCWTIMFITIAEVLPEKAKEKFMELFDKDAPVLTNHDTILAVKKTVKEIKKTVFPLHGLD